MKAFAKIIRPGTVKDWENRDMDVFVEITYTGDNEPDGKLSLHGVEGPTRSGNARGNAGQIVDSLKNIDPAPGWSRDMIRQLIADWDTWHLNDMRAGCEHQRAKGWGNERLSQPCPVCGYKYGSARLHETVPSEVLERLKALPDTDKTPAWV